MFLVELCCFPAQCFPLQCRALLVYVVINKQFLLPEETLDRKTARGGGGGGSRERQRKTERQRLKERDRHTERQRQLSSAEKAIVSQTNITTVPKATLGKHPRDEVERIWAFLTA